MTNATTMAAPRPVTKLPDAASNQGGRARHVTCDDISHTFTGERGEVEALRNVTVTIDAHEFVCIVGPSGCGKSTLLRIIAGLETPTAGEVRFDGEAAHRGVRGGLVVQEHGTFPWLTAVDNVAFGLAMEHMPKPERRARAMEYLERVGLSAFAKHYPHELSVGMRQRLGIGRAMVVDAPLLLMDEPFAALDAQTRRRMQDELLGIWAADRRTVLFVTHDIDEAVRLGDRVIVMSERPGRVLADIAVPLERPRDFKRDYFQVRGIIEEIWRLLDAPPEAVD